MIHNPCHARRAMASKARPWLGKGTHSAMEQSLRRMGSLPLAMLSFASHCEAGNDAVVVYQPTKIPGPSVADGPCGRSDNRRSLCGFPLHCSSLTDHSRTPVPESALL